MRSIRTRIEAGFEGLGRLIAARPYVFVLLVLLISGASMSALPKTTVDTSPTGMLHEKDPAMLDYRAFLNQFGRDEIIICGIGPVGIYSPAFLDKLAAFHERLEETVPHLDEVTSMVNARNTYGNGDTLEVGELLDPWPETPEDFKRLRQRVQGNPLYRNLLVSEDGRFTAVSVKTRAFRGEGGETDFFESGGLESAPAQAGERRLPTSEEDSESVLAVLAVADEFRSDDFPVYVAGTPVISHILKVWMLKDMRFFLSLTVVVIAIFLFLIFRTVAAVVWPIVTVLLSLFMTLGLMAATGTPLKMPTQILPSFLIAVGVAGTVHVLTIFYREMGRGHSRKEAVALTLGHSGLPITLTSLTTAGGLLSFSTAEIAPIADLGVFSSIGVLFCLLYSLLFLPAVLVIFPTKPRARHMREGGEARLDRFLAGVADFAIRRPWPVLLVSLVLIVFGGIGASRLHFSHNAVDWLPKESWPRVGLETLDENLRGTVTMEVVMETGGEDGFTTPEKLETLDRLAGEIEEYEEGPLFVGQTVSLADYLKEIHKALNEDQQGFYKIPESAGLVAQELLLFEGAGSDDLEEITTSDYKKTRFSIKVPNLDASDYVAFKEKVETLFQKALGPDVRITATGFLTILFSTLHALMHTMAESYLIAFGVISILMILLIGSFRAGLLAMVPNFMPILITMGIMGFTGRNLEAFTILVGSIAIGLAVDDTIHIMHNFRRYFDQTGDVQRALRLAFLTTGRALLFTSVILTSGFLVLAFATMGIVVEFGILTSTAIVLALLADFLTAPALITVFYGRKAKKGKQPE